MVYRTWRRSKALVFTEKVKLLSPLFNYMNNWLCIN